MILTSLYLNHSIDYELIKTSYFAFTESLQAKSWLERFFEKFVFLHQVL